MRERTSDTWGLWRRGVLHPESNVQFGEGGAGTFSDGKLWSRIKDPAHHGRKVLDEFVRAGAPAEILCVSKPHIGTFRLVTVVESLRETIEALGGEYRFGSRVVDLDLDRRAPPASGYAASCSTSGERMAAEHVVLAVGHSARDTFEMLHARGVHIEAKPFSIGVRIEHPQSLIDRARFGDHAGHPLLGAADYKLVHHARNGRSVYSFCMCPGGTVVAATSEPGRVVTNGMSQYSRNERNANAGIVVGITPGRLSRRPARRHRVPAPLGVARLRAGGGTYAAPVPARRRLPRGPAVHGARRGHAVLPAGRAAGRPRARACPLSPSTAIREALPAFGRQIPGFAMDDAVLTGVETRTSSPVRITRGASLQSLNTRGLYPAGEGAGYAGGILSAGVDGIRVAEAVALHMTGAACRRSPPESLPSASGRSSGTASTTAATANTAQTPQHALEAARVQERVATRRPVPRPDGWCDRRRPRSWFWLAPTRCGCGLPCDRLGRNTREPRR